MSPLNLFCEKYFPLSSLSLMQFNFLRVDLLFGGMIGLVKEETRKTSLLVVRFHMLARIRIYPYHKRNMKMSNCISKVLDK